MGEMEGGMEGGSALKDVPKEHDELNELLTAQIQQVSRSFSKLHSSPKVWRCRKKSLLSDSTTEDLKSTTHEVFVEVATAEFGCTILLVCWPMLLPLSWVTRTGPG